MRRKLPWFLVAASVALNIFFVAGFFYPQVMGHRHPPERVDTMARVVEELALTEGQAAALEAMRRDIMERREERRDGRDSFQAAILEAISAPTFDRAALAEALEARRADFGEFVLDLAEDLHGFVASLSPEQKTRFLERAEDRDFLRSLLFPRRSRDDRDD